MVMRGKTFSLVAWELKKAKAISILLRRIRTIYIQICTTVVVQRVGINSKLSHASLTLGNSSVLHTETNASMI